MQLTTKSRAFIPVLFCRLSCCPHLGRVRSRQVIPPALEEDYLQVVDGCSEQLCGVEVRRDVLTDGGVGAAAGLDGRDAIGGEGLLPVEELAVLLCEYVVGDGCDAVELAELLAEREHQSGFTAPNRPPEAHGEGPLLKVPPLHLLHLGVALVKVARMLHVLVAVTVIVLVAVTVVLAGVRVVVVLSGLASDTTGSEKLQGRIDVNGIGPDIMKCLTSQTY